MPIGDAADAAGMVVLAGTEDLRDTYIEHNRTRDYLANHQTGGTHPASAITSGTLPIERGGTGGGTAATAREALGITAENIPYAPGLTVDGALDYVGPVAEAAVAGNTTAAVYNRNITETRRAVYAGISGPIGYNLSTRASKQIERAAEWTPAQWRKVWIGYYRYLAEIEKEREDPTYHASLEVGSIAEDFHEADLWEFVVYDGEGDDAIPAGLRYELLGLPAIVLALQAHDRIDALTADLDALRNLIEGGANA